MYLTDQLSNGLRIVTHPMKGRDSVAVGIWIGVGGRYEEDSIKGAAHFLEHIVFKGSKQYTCKEIKENIEGVGGTLNAFTSDEQTCFFAKIPSKHLKLTFDILADMALFPKISKKDVVKESAVIVEEIKMYHDLPQYFVLELFDQLMWPDHPLGKSLTGTTKSVVGMTERDLKQFHGKFYSPGNIVVSVCGNVNHETIVHMVRRKMSSLKQSQRQDYLPVGKLQDTPNVKFYKKNIEQMHVALGAAGLDEKHPDRHALCLLSVLLGGNMSSRLFVEVREKHGLAYSIGCSAKTLHDTGQFIIRAGVDNQKITQAVQLILKELDKISRESVSTGEFKRAKDYLLGQFLLSLEDTMEHMLWIGESLIAKNECKTLKQVVNSYEKITRQDLKRVAGEILNRNKYKLAVVGPITDQQEKELTLIMGNY